MVILEVRIRTALEKLEIERIKKRIKIESLLSSYIFVWKQAALLIPSSNMYLLSSKQDKEVLQTS